MDYVMNYYKKSDEILNNLPEILTPGLTLLACAEEMGEGELSIALGIRYATVANLNVLLFTLDTKIAVPAYNSSYGKFIIDTEAHTFSHIQSKISEVQNLGMIVIINANYIQTDGHTKKASCDEEVFGRYKKINDKHKLPFLLTCNLSTKSITSRSAHRPVKRETINWHLIEEYLDNIILLHRENYYESMVDYEQSTHIIVEKSKSDRQRIFKV
jgi:hypothetical protein